MAFLVLSLSYVVLAGILGSLAVLYILLLDDVVKKTVPEKTNAMSEWSHS